MSPSSHFRLPFFPSRGQHPSKSLHVQASLRAQPLVGCPAAPEDPRIYSPGPRRLALAGDLPSDDPQHLSLGKCGFLADVAACPLVRRGCGEGVRARPHPPPTRARRTERSAVGVLRTTDGRPPKTNEEFENAIVAQLKKMMFDCDLDTITAKQVGLSPSSRSFP